MMCKKSKEGGKMAKQLSREAIEARRAYQKKYRQEHAEKIREAQERYWIKKAREMRENAGKNEIVK